MWYVYSHTRLDKNEIFYIGIGSTAKFKRAYSKTKRNQYWKNIVNKTNYTIEILFTDLSFIDACSKEIELIKLYGRKQENGTLCNLTIGGEGVKELKFTNTHKENISKSLTGRKLSEAHKNSLKGRRSTKTPRSSKNLSIWRESQKEKGLTYATKRVSYESIIFESMKEAYLFAIENKLIKDISLKYFRMILNNKRYNNTTKFNIIESKDDESMITI
jgi:hypothetical protein